MGLDLVFVTDYIFVKFVTKAQNLVYFLVTSVKIMHKFILFLLGIGYDIHDWHALPKKHVLNMIRGIPMWDFNETCIEGRFVRFSGEHAEFGESEMKAWNTAIMFAVDRGIAPPFMASRKC